MDSMTADSPQTLDHTRPRTITGRRKIAVVGYTYSGAEAPYGDPEWEVWGMNTLHELRRANAQGRVFYDAPALVAAGHFHAWFHLHPAEVIREERGMREWLQQDHGFPVYLFPGVHEQLGFTVANAEVFPKQSILDRFIPYFTNTVSWQVAHALLQLEGVEGAELGIWGVDLAVQSEYAQQRPSAEYFLGYAAGMGVKVTLPTTSDLLKSANLYGEVNPMQAKMEQREVELRDRRAQVVAQLEELSVMLHKLDGALENQSHWNHTWFQVTPSNREVMNPPSDGIALAAPPAG